ncbi:MAG: amino acid permease-associated region [Frankiales bacterium]|nr:amino acid permease-associated region [Frankiales bacterium]
MNRMQDSKFGAIVRKYLASFFVIIGVVFLLLFAFGTHSTFGSSSGSPLSSLGSRGKRQSIVVGTSASCAAMALTFASYAAPSHIRLVGVLAVVVLTALNYRGVQKSAWLTRPIVTLTLLTLAVVVIASLAGGRADVHQLTPFPGTDVRGVLQAGGLLFFAFAGYARIVTLGEEVRDPARTIPRAITIALLITLVVYAAVAVSALLAAGPGGLAATSTRLRAAVEGGRLHALAPVVQVGGAVAALGSPTTRSPTPPR